MNISLSAGVMVIRGTPDKKFVNCPLETTFLLKVGKILPLKENYFWTRIIFEFEILSYITWSHAIFGAIFGKMGGCFFDKMGACS